MKPRKYIGEAVIWFDRAVNWSIGRIRWGKYYIWSKWGGATNETISHTLGLEEAEWLAKQYRKIGDAVFQVKDIPIDSAAILGEFSSDLCDVFQPWHALRSIKWERRNAKTLCQKYPGLKELVEQFLTIKGVKS